MKKRFDRIKNEVENAKKKNLQARPQHGSPNSFYISNELIQGIVYRRITHEEALEKLNSTHNDIERKD